VGADEYEAPRSKNLPALAVESVKCMVSIKSRHPRQVLNEIKWRYDLNRCRVYYIHRGAPEDTKVIEGNVIKKIDRGFLILEGSIHIPYHRIFRIEYGDEVVFEHHK